MTRALDLMPTRQLLWLVRALGAVFFLLAAQQSYAAQVVTQDEVQAAPVDSELVYPAITFALAKRAVDALESNPSSVEFHKALFRLGQAHLVLHAPQVARQTFTRAYMLAKTGKDARLLASLAVGIGSSYAEERAFADAIPWFRQAHAFALMIPGSYSSQFLICISDAYLATADFSAAHSHATEALAEASQQLDTRGRAIAAERLSQLAWAEGNIERANEFASLSLSLATLNGLAEVRLLALSTLAKVAARSGRAAQVLRLQARHQALSDSLHKRRGHPSTSDLNTAILIQQAALRHEINAAERNTRYLLAVAAALSLGMIGASIFLVRTYMKSARVLRTEIEQTSFQQHYAQEQLATFSAEYEGRHANLRGSIAHLKQLNADLSARQQRAATEAADLNQSLEVAKSIQRGLLPPADQFTQAFADHFVLYHPRDVVSGDLYWMSNVAGRWVLAALDCTGHGVPGAVMTMLAYSQLNQVILGRGILDPGEALGELHRGVRRMLKQETNESRDGLDIALCVIDPKRKSLSFAGANLPLMYVHRGEVHELKPDKYSVGGVQHETHRVYTTSHLLYDSDYTFYLFSDGVYHQFGGANRRKLTIAKFYNLIQQSQHADLSQQAASLLASLHTWRGEMRQVDDWMVIGFRAS